MSKSCDKLCYGLATLYRGRGGGGRAGGILNTVLKNPIILSLIGAFLSDFQEILVIALDKFFLRDISVRKGNINENSKYEPTINTSLLKPLHSCPVCNAVLISFIWMAIAPVTT